MAITNAKVANFLRHYASILTLEGADRFKVKAYRRAADTLETIQDDVARLVAHGEDLKQLPGIGRAISSMVTEIVKTERLPQLEAALSKLQPELVELASKPALDPKKVMRVYKKLKINSLAELKNRLQSGEVRNAFGARLDYHIRQGLEERPQMLLWAAEKLAAQIEVYLKTMPGITKVARVGSLRRKKEVVGDFNYLVSGKTASQIFKRFGKFGAVQSTEPRGTREVLFRLSTDRNVSLTWTPIKQWGFALLLHTGSEAHLSDLRAQAEEVGRGLTARALGADASNETSIYAKIGLKYIEPELREGRGEVQAAVNNTLPRLVQRDDLCGDLHMHTTASDGANTLEEMAEAAQARGYKYIAITDHSQSLKITNGLTEKRLFQQIKAIDKLNAQLKKLVILKSAEVDILEDGRLDYSNSALKELDFTIGSIHSRFALNQEQQTERIMRAMDNPYFNILGHATGRLLLKREGYDLDLERIFKHAKQNGCLFEINSSPNRLDLSDENVRIAKEMGIKIAVNTDAHSIEELNFISAGVNQARRGWLERTDILNTFPLKKLQALLRR